MASIVNSLLSKQPLPLRKESYTTWLYLGLAVVVAVATVYGMWYAGLQAPR
jgi:hypothetical protein